MSHRGRGVPWQEAVFVLLVIAHLVPVWAFSVFPSQDGPAHLDNANVIRRYDEPGRGLFRQYYALAGPLEPNWAGHFFLAGLLRVADPKTAEKLLVSLCVLALALAARYAVRPGASWPALLVLPFSLGWSIHMGFYYFSLSLALFFVAVGYWLRHEDLRARELATLAVLGLALHFSHLVSLLAAVIVTTLLGVHLLARERSRMAAIRIAKTLAAFAPGLLLTGFFFLERPWASYPASPPMEQLRKLSSLEPLVSFADPEALPAAAIFWTFAAVTTALLVLKLVRRSFARHDGLLLAAAGMIAIYVFAPGGAANGGYLSPRLAIYPFLLLTMWFAAEDPPRLVRVAAQAAAAGLAVLLLFVRLPFYREAERGYAEYLAAGALVKPDTTLLALRQGEPRARGEAHSDRADVFLHAGGYIAAEKNVVQLVNYEARTGHFPTAFRVRWDPYMHLGDPERNPPCVDLANYKRRTGRAVDYVLLWQFPVASGDPCTRLLLEQLRLDYQPVFTSESGRARLFRVQAP
ncbi:MAG TPA: hypothetical protein VGL15_15070 [Vicinamibacteria bacterium]